MVGAWNDAAAGDALIRPELRSTLQHLVNQDLAQKVERLSLA
jgi:hypothetical protein